MLILVILVIIIEFFSLMYLMGEAYCELNKKIEKLEDKVETKKQNIIEKLKEDIEQYYYMAEIVETESYEEGYYKGHISEAQEILKILKGEKDDRIRR